MEADNRLALVPMKEIIEIIYDHKPTGNIYNGHNSKEERTDERICDILDDVASDIVNNYPDKIVNDVLNLNSNYHTCVLNTAIRSAMNTNEYTIPILTIKYAITCLPFLSDETVWGFQYDCDKKFAGKFDGYKGAIWNTFYQAVIKEITKRGLQKKLNGINK